MIPEHAFIRVFDTDSPGSLEHRITETQAEHTLLMEQWEETFPIEAIQTPTGPFWKDSKGCLVIPPDRDLKWDIMHERHNGPLARHPGRDRTTCRINKSYFWPGARTWVDQYIKGCATCQQNKNLMHCLKTPMFQITSPPNAKPFS
jgi:hypothetical protein